MEAGSTRTPDDFPDAGGRGRTGISDTSKSAALLFCKVAYHKKGIIE